MVGGSFGYGRLRRPQQSFNNVTTFFFSNFPDNYGEYDMVKVFQRWARVKEVFISRRMNRWGRRYGFVRLFNVANVRGLEREMDQAWVGNMKLYVNIPRYRRSELVHTEVPLRGKGVQSERSNMEERNGHRFKLREGNKKEEGRHYKGKERKEWREVNKNQSYADVVEKGPLNVWKGPIFETKQQTLPWLNNSAVGFFSGDLSYNQVCEEFILGGMNMVKVRYLGDNMALITPNQGARVEDIIRTNKQWFESVFEAVEPWTDAHVARHKIIWVRCYGLPISLWNKDCFSKVVGEVASLVEVDKATEIGRTWSMPDFRFVFPNRVVRN
ncbi:uncharacterized protein [Phaseolus vulgaris]|uniref:uncharacterized protein n=1 Tax=Phaseolus vulgaris TaxID=3885 RepID=UPI0035CA6B1D